MFATFTVFAKIAGLYGNPLLFFFGIEYSSNFGEFLPLRALLDVTANPYCDEVCSLLTPEYPSAYHYRGVPLTDQCPARHGFKIHRCVETTDF